MLRLLKRLLGLVLLLQLTACASLRSGGSPAVPATATAPLAQMPWAIASTDRGDLSQWRHLDLPGKRPTQFVSALLDGRDTMAVTAISSASMLRKKVHIESAELGRVRFSWKVPALMADADMALRDKDDAPVRIVLAFEGDRSTFSAKNQMLSELARALTGEEMPYATLMYVWCNHREPGSVILNPRTDRIRKLVVETGTVRLNQWLDYERDIRADFLKAFGEPPGALVAVGIMTDSDNTRSTTTAWYGPVTTLSPSPPR